MNERDALLKAVCDNPHEDTPRLVFADWLQEHGEEERAEFIRVQIERSRVREGGPEWEAFHERERELLSGREARWRAELPVEPGWVWQGFFRGFVDELIVNSAADPSSDPARAFAAAPLVALSLIGNPLRPWIPHLRHVRMMTLLSSDFTDDDVAALCSPAAGLRFEELSITLPDAVSRTGRTMLFARFGSAVRLQN
jgi:uncharacterized protein (TIGR02996 family)